MNLKCSKYYITRVNNVNYQTCFSLKNMDGNERVKRTKGFSMDKQENIKDTKEKKKIVDNKKDELNFISIIRLPDFVTKKDFDWAVDEATKKKKTDFSKVEFLTYDEGLCVQCMHVGSYDDEPATVDLMHKYMEENGYELDITDTRFHHEIYLSDPRRCDESRLKTVVRHPIKRTRE